MTIMWMASTDPEGEKPRWESMGTGTVESFQPTHDDAEEDPFEFDWPGAGASTMQRWTVETEFGPMCLSLMGMLWGRGRPQKSWHDWRLDHMLLSALQVAYGWKRNQ